MVSCGLHIDTQPGTELYSALSSLLQSFSVRLFRFAACMGNVIMKHLVLRHCISLLLLLGLAWITAGCGSTQTRKSTEQTQASQLDSAARPPDVTNRNPPGPVREVELGFSVRSRPIKATVFEAQGLSRCILILGGIHGDEPVSTALMEELEQHLRAHPEDRAGKTIVLIPKANPDGLVAGTRHNARDVDLNRNFLTPNFKAGNTHGPAPLSEPESLILVEAIGRYGPSTVVSVHGPLDCIDPDGGAGSRRLARSMVKASPLPYKDLNAHPGSMGSYVGEKLGLNMITYELDRKKVPGSGAARYLQNHIPAMLAAIQEG